MNDQSKPASGEHPDRVPIKEFMQAQWDKDKPATGSQNPGREEIYDEMTAHIKGDKPASGEWTLHEDGYGILEWHPKHKDGVGMLCRCHDKMEAQYTVDAHNAALAASLPDERWVTQQLQAANKLCAGLQEQVQTLRDALVKAQHRFNKSGWPEAAKEIEDALARH